MVNRAYEWYRVVNVKPTSQTLDNRKLAAIEVTEIILKANSLDLALNCATGVAGSFDADFDNNSSVIKTLIGAIRSHESAFPEDLSENALELRVCAAIALGEAMGDGGDKAPTLRALQIASLLRAGLGVRPPVEGKHLRQMLDELAGVAARVLASGGLARRHATNTPALLEQSFESESSLQLATSKLDRLTLKQIHQQAAIDREELNVLWWMFAGASTTTRSLIAELPAGAAALCCGAELGSLCLVPPTEGLEAMVRRAYKTEREPAGMTERNIEQIAVDWNSQFQSALIPDEGSRTLGKDYPSLFPLSWLCNRLLASKSSPNWASEFRYMTGVPFDYPLSPANWAIQAFRERTAHRICAEKLKARAR